MVLFCIIWPFTFVERMEVYVYCFTICQYDDVVGRLIYVFSKTSNSEAKGGEFAIAGATTSG